MKAKHLISVILLSGVVMGTGFCSNDNQQKFAVSLILKSHIVPLRLMASSGSVTEEVPGGQMVIQPGPYPAPMP